VVDPSEYDIVSVSLNNMVSLPYHDWNTNTTQINGSLPKEAWRVPIAAGVSDLEQMWNLEFMGL